MSDTVIESTDTQNRTAGSLLSAARESLGFSQKDIADQLYLTPSFIELIDKDEGQKIPKQAFVKGYLRSYAKIVGLDGDEIVGMFDVTYVKPGKVDMRRVSTDSISPIHFTGPVLKTGIVGLLAFVLVIGAVWYISANKKSESETNAPETISPETISSETNSPETLSLIENSPETVAPQTTTSLELQNETSGQDVALPSEPQSEQQSNSDDALQDQREPAVRPEALDALAIELASDEPGFANELQDSDLATEVENESNVDDGVTINRQREDGVNYIYVDAGGIDRLNFVFTDECWLEVIDADGTKIFADLGVSGDEISVTGIAPFRLLFGDATVVTLSVNGESFDLGRYTGDDQTAKVRVGT